jgi:hypothetical protein
LADQETREHNADFFSPQAKPTRRRRIGLFDEYIENKSPICKTAPIFS